jgi:hypothetical protein
MGFFKSRWDRAGITNLLVVLGLDSKRGNYIAAALPEADLQELQRITGHLDKGAKYYCLSLAAVEYSRFYLKQERNKETWEPSEKFSLLKSAISDISNTLVSGQSQAEKDGKIDPVTSEALATFTRKYRD